MNNCTSYTPIVDCDQVPFVQKNKLRTRIDVIADLLLSSLGEWRDDGPGRWVNDTLDAVCVDGYVSMFDAPSGQWLRCSDRRAADPTEATEIVAELAAQASLGGAP